MGHILHPSQLTFYTDAFVIASLQLARSVLHPQQAGIAKLGNALAPQGVVQRKKEACSGVNVPWCYFKVSENNPAINQEIPGLKTVARCSDAILRAHA